MSFVTDEFVKTKMEGMQMKRVLAIVVAAVLVAGSMAMDVSAATCSHANKKIRVDTEVTTYTHSVPITTPSGFTTLTGCTVTKETDTAKVICTSCGAVLQVLGSVSRESHSVSHN